MRKEPGQRYRSAEEFSSDIGRYLSHWPVLARRGSFRYVVRKFVARHKLAVSLSAVATLLTVAGVAGVIVESRIARAERAKAERRFNDVRKLAGSVMFEMNDGIVNLPGSTAVRRLLLTRSLEYLDSLAKEAAGRCFPATRSCPRLLTNATYAGRVEHKGTIYPGEQAAILDPEVWEEINAELRGARRGPNHVKRTKQDGLLNGLLFCRNCDQPMVPTYTAKGDRRYRYYICQVARKKGWSACPTKSIAARMIEESVVKQLRSTLSVDGAREQFRVSDADWLAFDEGDPSSLVRAAVKRVAYDGVSGAVSLELGHK